LAGNQTSIYQFSSCTNGLTYTGYSETQLIGGQVYNVDLGFGGEYTYDASFNVGGVGISARNPSGIIKLNSGSIIAVGNFDGYNGNLLYGVAKMSNSGVFDGSFTGASFATGGQRAIIELSDNKLIVIDRQFNEAIFGLNSNGTVNAGFAVGTGFNNGKPLDIKRQSNDKILVGGSLFSYQTTPIPSL
jgi:hypothetical protein